MSSLPEDESTAAFILAEADLLRRDEENIDSEDRAISPLGAEHIARQTTPSSFLPSVRRSSTPRIPRVPVGARRQVASGASLRPIIRGQSLRSCSSGLSAPVHTSDGVKQEDFEGRNTSDGRTESSYASSSEPDSGAEVRDGLGIKSYEALNGLKNPCVMVEEMAPAPKAKVTSPQDSIGKGRAPSWSPFVGIFPPTDGCVSSRPFHQNHLKWASISILILSVFSTIFSGIYAIIALRKPRYGRYIRDDGPLTPSTASFLTALFAKLVEVSFVTVFVAFLGQVISRRIFMRGQGRGVSLAEFGIRTWMMQPGSLVTHWEGVKYAGWTVLGVASLTTTVITTLYTTASDALVQPQLKTSDWRHRTLIGMVVTCFANQHYLEQRCKTPISMSTDDISSTTCVQVNHAGEANHNYKRYIDTWTDIVDREGNSTSDLQTRPPGFALLDDNILIDAPWVEIADTANASAQWGRVVNNVSMAVPHPGVVSAAQNERNGIIQSKGSDGLGIYSVQASVTNPVVHVLCANMKRTELSPIVYAEWPFAKELDTSTWPAQLDGYSSKSDYNATVVDDLFHWGEKYNTFAPVFPKLPLDYNILLVSTLEPWGFTSIYLLGKNGLAKRDEYSLCQLSASLTPMCSTHYYASDSGGSLRASCSNPPDPLAHIRVMPNATRGRASLNADWPSLALEWAQSVGLKAGISDGNAGNARLLTELILEEPTLNPSMPSFAETLAVMASCTLITSTVNTPFYSFWNYTEPCEILDTPQPQTFSALMREKEYASGGVYDWQHALYPVIVLLFLANVGVLAYFLSNRGLVTDFSEPLNLFSLAVNSPAAPAMRGSCGAGPSGDQLGVRWVVGEDRGHLFIVREEAAAGVRIAVTAADETQQQDRGGGWLGSRARRLWHALLNRRRSQPHHPYRHAATSEQSLIASSDSSKNAGHGIELGTPAWMQHQSGSPGSELNLASPYDSPRNSGLTAVVDNAHALSPRSGTSWGSGNTVKTRASVVSGTDGLLSPQPPSPRPLSVAERTELDERRERISRQYSVFSKRTSFL